MACMVSGREIILSGDVGDVGGWFWDGDSFSSSDVILALAQVGNANDVTIRLNSGGGIAWEGSAIHSAIARHAGRKTIIIEGIAASAASIIAMAGDDVVMALGAMMMVHSPSGMTVGTAKDHQDQINCLGALAASMATIYAAKTGQSPEACQADMQAETWMTADQAVAKGYADRVITATDDGEDDDDPLQQVEPAPFAYRTYKHAPERIVALADAKAWNKRLPRAAAPAAPQHPETGMKPKAEQPAPVELEAKPAPAVSEPAGGSPPATRSEPVTEPTTEPVFSRADAAEIIDICNAGGAPSMAGTLVREGVTAEAARERVNAAGQIKEIVALARKNAPHLAADLADKAIASGKSVAAVKADLFDAMAAADEALPITAVHRAGAGGTNNPGATTDDDARAKSKASMQAEIARAGLKK